MFIFNFFNEYFLLLMLLECFIVLFIDSPKFKELDKGRTAKKAKYLGIGIALISIVLFVIKVLK